MNFHYNKYFHYHGTIRLIIITMVNFVATTFTYLRMYFQVESSIWKVWIYLQIEYDIWKVLMIYFQGESSINFVVAIIAFTLSPYEDLYQK